MGKEAELTVFGLVVVLVLGAAAWYTTHLLAAGKDEEKAAVAAVTLKAQAAADVQSANWQTQLTLSEQAHAAELNQLAADDIGPATVSVRKLTIAAAGVSSNSAAPSGVIAPGAGGQLPGGVVCESSRQLSDAYAERQRADRMNADYRELYDAWPAPPQ